MFPSHCLRCSKLPPLLTWHVFRDAHSGGGRPGSQSGHKPNPPRDTGADSIRRRIILVGKHPLLVSSVRCCHQWLPVGVRWSETTHDGSRNSFFYRMAFFVSRTVCYFYHGGNNMHGIGGRLLRSPDYLLHWRNQ
uniref:Uncharacterized protein n=1 Tax=Cacopsylla melanoneura TaxID=428564 RepID=A0A8D8Y104_9HEMI